MAIENKEIKCVIIKLIKVHHSLGDLRIFNSQVFFPHAVGFVING